MDYAIRAYTDKRAPLHFLVDGLQVWISYVDGNENGPFGVLFKWMEDKHDSEPLQHITEDGGHSYHQVKSYGTEDGIEKRKGTLETDPERLNRLQRIWIEYQKALEETVFSV